MIQEQIIDEIRQIPDEKLVEVYDLIHYFRLGLLHEKRIHPATDERYPLRGLPLQFDNPTGPVALEDWEVLK
jgi:hypothetical protein